MTQRIVAGGIIGNHEGMFWSQDAPANGDIDADNDGVMDPAPRFTIDMSRVAARALGYQASMMAGYKLHRLTFAIRPVNDDFDNDYYASFVCDFKMYPATQHAEKALSLARRVEKADESSQMDADSLFLSDDKDYSGFRYGWNGGYQDHPIYTTQNSITGMSSVWCLDEIFGAYDLMTEAPQSNAIFGGRAPEIMTSTQVASWTTGTDADAHSGVSPYRCEDSTQLHNLMILPLIEGQIKYSTGDEPGLIDDDYNVFVELEFTPEAGGVF